MGTSATIVIPNWNGLVHLEECLTALRGQTLSPARVLIIDNASTDGSEGYVREQFPEVEWVQMPENGGFSYAVNEGIRRADTEYVALLNNDTAVEPGWLEALVAALEQHADYDVAASRMILYYDRHLMNAAGDVYQLLRGVGKNRGLLRPVERYGETCRVLAACAGAALYRRSLFDEVGLFDEGFFLVSEDMDISLRALIAGKKTIYVPSAVVFHKLRATIDTEPSEKMVLLAARNEAMVVGKDLPLPAVAIVILGYPWRVFRSTFPARRDQWHRIPALLRNWPARFRAERQGLAMGWSKRADVWSRRKVSTLVIMRWLIRGVGGL